MLVGGSVAGGRCNGERGRPIFAANLCQVEAEDGAVALFLLTKGDSGVSGTNACRKAQTSFSRGRPIFAVNLCQVEAEFGAIALFLPTKGDLGVSGTNACRKA